MSDLDAPSDTPEESWADFLAPDVAVGDGDLDGVVDTVLVDADADGVADAVLVDTDADAVANTVVMDSDADGVADIVLVDTDADSVADGVYVAAAGAGDAATEAGLSSRPEGAALDQSADDDADAPGELDPGDGDVNTALWAQDLQATEGEGALSPFHEDPLPTDDDVEPAEVDFGEYL